jgi:hypothetical protein
VEVGAALMEWTAYDRERKQETTPEGYELVWIFNPGEDEVTLGYFDGIVWCLWGGSDDCWITHWAPIEYPGAPPVGG